MKYVIDIPHTLIISSNMRLRRGKHGRFYLNPEYKEAKQNLIALFLQAKQDYNIDSNNKEATIDVAIHINKALYKGDLDNASKIILDALQAAAIICNDRHIRSLYLCWQKQETTTAIVEVEIV